MGGKGKGGIDGDAEVNDRGDVWNWIIEDGEGVKGAGSEGNGAAFGWGECELP